jgi:uncharacterized protein (TIGR00369 family)
VHSICQSPNDAARALGTILEGSVSLPGMVSHSSDDSRHEAGGRGFPGIYESVPDGDGSAGIPLLRFLGVRLVTPSAPDVAVSLEMDRSDDVLNLAGQPHGGAIAALIDHTGGLAVGAVLGHSGPTADLHVRYLRAAEGSPIRADARVLRAGRRLAVVEVRVYGQSGELSAIATMTTAPRENGPVTVD